MIKSFAKIGYRIELSMNPADGQEKEDTIVTLAERSHPEFIVNGDSTAATVGRNFPR
jgi:hypothetical protein